MELNLETTPLLSEPRVAAQRDLRKSKGTWRKRRRDVVAGRAKASASNSEQGQKSTFATAANDEFASGWEGTPESNESKKENSQVQHLGRQKSTAIGRQSGKGHDKLPQKRQRVVFNDVDKSTYPKKVKQIRSRGPVDSKLESEEAIKATLEVVGGFEAKKDGGTNLVPQKLGQNENSNTSSETMNVIPERSTFCGSDFESLGLYSSIAKHLKLRMEIEKPTHIQEQVMKALLRPFGENDSWDILVRSATGSGKTLAYLLPIAHYLLNRSKRVSREDGAMALVLVPTRELAVQVEDVAKRLFQLWHWIVVGSVRGGESKKSEKARIRKGVNVLIATPGRLLDHIRNTKRFNYAACEFLVLDEADRLLDLGFEADIKEIIESFDNAAKFNTSIHNSKRCNIMLSATMRSDVERLASFSLQEPVQISVKEEPGLDSQKFSMPSQLKQHLCVVEQRHRLVTLTAFLRLRALRGCTTRTVNNAPDTLPSCKIVVFFSSCDSVDFHYDALPRGKLPNELQSGVKIDNSQNLIPLSFFRLHGSLDQQTRLSSLQAFRKCHRGILLCTDVAARGLDLKGVSFSVQYDPPTGGQGEELEYVHRAGRTARLGERGDALLFLLPSERAYQSKLTSAGIEIKEISHNTALAALLPGADLTQPGKVSHSARLVTSAIQEALEKTVQGSSSLKEKAYAGYLSCCRAYATHAKDVKHYFHVRNLHLGHVARAFALVDKPADLARLVADIKRAKEGSNIDQNDEKAISVGEKGSIARAIANGELQPFNNPHSMLARRRREKGRSVEAYKELASEFAS